jgi:hypothetical protein
MKGLQAVEFKRGTRSIEDLNDFAYELLKRKRKKEEKKEEKK